LFFGSAVPDIIYALKREKKKKKKQVESRNFAANRILPTGLKSPFSAVKKRSGLNSQSLYIVSSVFNQ
jgi:hypothetical protein